MSQRELLSSERVRRTIARLAYEVVERNRGAEDLVVLGIERRGVPLAKALAAVMGEIEGARIESASIDVTPFRDDLDAPVELPELGSIPDVKGRHVILVDDVLFTGRTVRAAIDAVLHHGRPASIQLAVLVDRGHREYPMRADYLGLEVPTKREQRVIVTIGDDNSVVVRG